MDYSPVFSNRKQTIAVMFAICAGLVLVAGIPRDARAYVEIPYTLGRLVNESTHIMLLQVEKVDKTKNLIVYRKLKDVKGVHPTDVVKHAIGQAGFSPREWQTIMAWAEPGKTAVFFHNGSASETCIGNYWYQAYAGDWWSMSHAEPFMLRSYVGKPERLAGLIGQMLEGKEVIVSCMVDGDKAALQTATAKVQRFRASLKLVEYDPKRDFLGWGGNEEFRRLLGMPAFQTIGSVGQTGPDATGVATADFNGDGKIDVCLYGGGRTVLLKNEGNSFSEFSLPYGGPARSADWADYDKDGKPDLLLATAKGPKLFLNKGETFNDVSAGFPAESYHNGTAAVFIDMNNDTYPDVLYANGYLGLRVYRNLGPVAQQEAVEPSLGEWYYQGPFDNTGGVGFDAVYPPEKGINTDKGLDLETRVDGKGKTVRWKKGAFTDGQINNLRIFGNDDNSVAYLFREIVTGAVDMPISVGSDDSLKVWLNGENLISENVNRACIADQTRLTLKLKPGKNQLLLKVCNGTGDFAFYFQAHGKPVAINPLFADDSAKWGLGPQGIAGKLKGDRLSVVDFDGDGRQDFFYAAERGVLVRNTPQGFVEQKDTGIVLQGSGSTPVWADFDGDKRPDLMMPQAGVCRFYRNAGNGKFTDVTAQAGDLSQAIPGLTNAAVCPPLQGGGPGLIVGCLRGPNRYFRNDGGKFVDATAGLGLQQQVFNTRALSVGDLNQDGAVDAVFNNEGQDAVILLGNPEYSRAAKTAAAR